MPGGRCHPVGPLLAQMTSGDPRMDRWLEPDWRHARSHPGVRGNLWRKASPLVTQQHTSVTFKTEAVTFSDAPTPAPTGTSLLRIKQEAPGRHTLESPRPSGCMVPLVLATFQYGAASGCQEPAHEIWVPLGQPSCLRMGRVHIPRAAKPPPLISIPRGAQASPSC